MKTGMVAIIKKDIRGITNNRRLFLTLLIVPFVFSVIFPSVFVLAIHLTPEDPDFMDLLALLPGERMYDSLELTLVSLLFNYIFPSFFLLIPIMASSIMAASAFVGEKERNTLETLLYSPLTLKQIFQAKVLACFILSMTISLFSFLLMFTVVETELYFMTGSFLIHNVNWLVVILLISPSVSLIAITLIVRQSAKAQSVEESQQGAVFLIIPLVLLVVGQISGLFVMNVWLLLALGVVCAFIAWILLQKSMGRFTYEKLLK